MASRCLLVEFKGKIPEQKALDQNRCKMEISMITKVKYRVNNAIEIARLEHRAATKYRF